MGLKKINMIAITQKILKTKCHLLKRYYEQSAVYYRNFFMNEIHVSFPNSLITTTHDVLQNMNE